LLYDGSAQRVALNLREHALHAKADQKLTLNSTAAYFSSRIERMQYHDFRNAGFPIGSGLIEGYAKTTKQRFAGLGMRWSRPGINTLLSFTAAEASESFDAYWRRRCP
jgi:hypothetical protein